MHHYVNLGIAVDLDFEGLLVPVIHDADGKRLRAIAREISDLAPPGPSQEARRPTTSPAAPSRSPTPARSARCMTLPIINQPQVAILSTDGVKRRPVVVDLPDGSEAHRHPLGRQPRPRLGPPGLRRRLRRRVPAPGQGDPRDPRLGRRAVTLEPAMTRPLRVRWLGRVPLPRRARAPARRCSSDVARRPPAAARAPARLHARRAGRPAPRARRRRPRSAPSWCAPTGAATSPTTAPASWSATRSSSLPGKRGGGDGRHRRPTSTSVEQLLIDALADLGPARRRPARASTPACGSTPTATIPARSPPSACGSPGAASMHGFALNVDPDLALLRPHRAVRHRRQGGHVAGGRGRRRRRCATSSTPSSARAVALVGGPTPARGARRRRVAPPARRPVGLHAVARPGRDRRRRRRPMPRSPVRLAGPPAPRPASTEGLADRDAQARVAAGRASASAPTTCGSSARCATSTSSPCARRPAARTSSSAGPTARPRS